jgi:hypothetical protein
MYVCVCVCMHARMYVCMYVCMHACMHVCMYVCMYVCLFHPRSYLTNLEYLWSTPKVRQMLLISVPIGSFTSLNLCGAQMKLCRFSKKKNWSSYKKLVKVASLCFNWAICQEGVLGEWMYSSTHSLTSALDGGEWSSSRPSRFTPRERAPGTQWIGGWVGPRASVDTAVKNNTDI